MEYVLTEEDRAEISGKLADYCDDVAKDLDDEGDELIYRRSLVGQQEAIVRMSVGCSATGFRKLAYRLRESGL